MDLGGAFLNSGDGSFARGVVGSVRCRANVAHITQSGPYSGRGFQSNILKTSQVLAFLLGALFRSAHAFFVGSTMYLGSAFLNGGDGGFPGGVVGEAAAEPHSEELDRSMHFSGTS